MSRDNRNSNNRPRRNDYIFDEDDYKGFEPVYDEDRRAYNNYNDYNKTGSGRRYEDAYDDTYAGYTQGDSLRRSRAESGSKAGMMGANTRPDSEEAKSKKKSKMIKGVLITVFSLLIVAINVVAVMAFKMLNNVNTITSQQVEEHRVTGDELAELDKEFAAETTVTDTQVELPTDYIMSTDDVSILFLVGSDSRFGVSKEARSDTMMIIGIDRVNKKLKMVSIMRDLYALIPGYKDHKINTAFYYDSRYGNLDLKITLKTIENNLGVKLEDYVIVDFSGFRNIIDLLGGVTLEVTKDEANYMCSHVKYGLFPRYSAGAGTYTMNGAEALNYCRMRKVGNGDYARTERQRKVISRIVAQMKGADVSTLYSAAMAGMDSVVTNLSTQEITGYAMEAVDILGYEIVQMRIPIEGSFEECSVDDSGAQMSVLWPNYSWNAKQLKKFLFEDDMTYANGGVAKRVTIPDLPSSAKPPTSASESQTTEAISTEASAAEGETTTTASTATSATTTTTTAAATTTTTAATTASTESGASES